MSTLAGVRLGFWTSSQVSNPYAALPSGMNQVFAGPATPTDECPSRPSRQDMVRSQAMSSPSLQVIFVEKSLLGTTDDGLMVSWLCGLMLMVPPATAPAAVMYVTSIVAVASLGLATVM